MTISEFSQHAKARKGEGTIWYVDILLNDGSENGQPSTLTVGNATSEYDAKEQAFFYLTHLLTQKNQCN